MRLVALLCVCAGLVVAGSSADAATKPANVLKGTYTRLNGEKTPLSAYRGKVVLVVNTATQCGFTPQFDGLEKLYKTYKGKGLVLLGFPSNDFAQESRSNKAIGTFCKNNYGVTFPMFGKTHVLGANANGLYTALTSATGAPVWNFNKYLLDRRGRVVAHFTQNTEPLSADLVGQVKKLL